MYNIEVIGYQDQSEISEQFKRKQIAVWTVLLLFVATVTIFLLYFAYQIMKRGSIESGGGIASVLTPISSLPAPLAAKEPAKEDPRYFLYGEFSQSDKKYKIYKTRYIELTREEIFSFPWSDSINLPALSAHGEHLAVYPSPNNGFLINHEGKIENFSGFIPPTQYFSISPDGKKILYLRFLSSLGNPILLLRDLEKDADIFRWPASSPASNICEFSGWLSDGSKAYCLVQKGSTAGVREIDVKKYAYKIIASAPGASSTAYNAEHSIFAWSSEGKIFTLNTATGEKREIAQMPDGLTVPSLFTAPDASKILYAVGNQIYSIGTDGSDARKLPIDGETSLISVSPDSKNILVKKPDKYLIADLDGRNANDLFTAPASDPDIQFVGWFDRQP